MKKIINYILIAFLIVLLPYNILKADEFESNETTSSQQEANTPKEEESSKETEETQVEQPKEEVVVEETKQDSIINNSSSEGNSTEIEPPVSNDEPVSSETGNNTPVATETNETTVGESNETTGSGSTTPSGETNETTGNEPSNPPQNILIESILVTSDVDEIFFNQQLQMYATILPDNATNKNIIWSVIDGTGSATIDENGLLTALTPGTVTVRAIAEDEGSVYGSKVITIKQIYVESLTINGSSSVQRTKTTTYSVTVTPSTAYDKSIEWSVEDITGHATISSSGTLTAINNGTIKVIAKAKDTMQIIAEKEVEIIPLAVTSVSITGSDKLNVGDRERYIATINPSAADDQTITWSITSGSEYATIDETGLLTATAAGTIQIRATSTNGKTSTKSITIVSETTPTKLILTAQSYYVQWLSNSNTTIYARPYSSDQSISSITWSATSGDSFCNSYTSIRSSGTVNGLSTATLSYECYKNLTLTVTAKAVINGQTISNTIKINAGSSTNAYTHENHATNIQTVEVSKKMEIGDEEVFNVTYTPTNAPISDILYNISDNNIAHIDANGRVYAKSIGYATLYAFTKYNNKIISIPISVVEDKTQPLSVVKIDISGPSTVERDTTANYSATVYPVNAANKNITWEVKSIDGEASITQDGVLTAIRDGQVKVIVSADDNSGVSATKIVTISRTYVTNIDINGPSTVERTKNISLTANIAPSNAYNKNIVWSVINGTGEATIDQNGNLTGVKEGTVTVRVDSTDDSGIYQEKTITVTPIYVKGITIQGEKFVIVGRNYNYRYSITNEDADNKAVIWSVENDTGEATIDENGVLTAISAGEVIVKATATDDSDISTSFSVKINDEGSVEKIIVLSPSTSIQVQSGLQLTALVYPTNIESNGITWSIINQSSSNASISETGYLTAGSKAGTITVRATSNDGSGVYGEVDLAIFNDVLNVGESVEYAVTNSSSCTATSSNPNVVSVSVAYVISPTNNGTYRYHEVTITGLRPGESTVTIIGSSTSQSLKISVFGEIGEMHSDVDKIKIGIGETSKINISFDGPTTDYYFVSLDNSIVNVDQDGNIIGKEPGSTIIKVYSKYGNKELSIPVTIVKYTTGIELINEEITLNNNQSNYQIEYSVLPEDATNKNVNFTSEDTSIATVDANGVIYAVNNGSTYINVISEDGKSSTRIRVIVENYIPCDEIIAEDLIHIYTSNENPTKVLYEITPSNSNPIIKFKIDNTSVATISNDGYLTAVSTGITKLMIYANEVLKKEITININDYVSVTSLNILKDNIVLTSEGKIKTYQVEYEINPTNATNKIINWTSSNPEIATVDANGIVTAISNGNCVINAVTEDGNYSDSINVQIITGYNTISYYYTSPYQYGSSFLRTETIYYGDNTKLLGKDDVNIVTGYSFGDWYTYFYDGYGNSYEYGSFSNPVNLEQLTFDGSEYTLYLKQEKNNFDYVIKNAYISGNYFYLEFDLDPLDTPVWTRFAMDTLYNNTNTYGLSLVDTNYNGGSNGGHYYASFSLTPQNDFSNYASIYHCYYNSCINYSFSYKTINGKYYKEDVGLSYMTDSRYDSKNTKYYLYDPIDVKVHLDVDIVRDIFEEATYIRTDTLGKANYNKYLYQVKVYNKNDYANVIASYSNEIVLDSNNDAIIYIGNYSLDYKYDVSYYAMDDYGNISPNYLFAHNVYIEVPEINVETNTYNSMKISVLNRSNFREVAIYRKKYDENDYTYIGTITDNSNYYIDMVPDYTTYYYKAKGVSFGTYTNFSNDYYYQDRKTYGYPKISKPIVSYRVTNDKTVKITWGKVDGAKEYNILKCNNSGTTCDWIKTLKSSVTSYSYKKLKLGKTYYFRVNVGSKPIKNAASYNESDLMIIKAKPSKGSVSLSKKSYNAVNVNVSGGGNPTYYEIYRSTKKNKYYGRVATVYSPGLFVDDTVAPSVTYYYKVRACNESGCGSYSKVKSIKPVLVTPKISLTSNANKQTIISYNYIEGAMGYDIYRSTNKKKSYKYIGTSYELSFVDNPPLNKTQYYKIRAFVIINGKKYYSGYSNIKSIKLTLSKPTISAIKDELGVNVNNSLVAGADGYNIYRSTNKKKSYKNIGTTLDGNFRDEIIITRKQYYKVRAYKIINGKKYYSGYSNIFTII